MAGLGAKVTAIDFSDKFIAIAKSKGVRMTFLEFAKVGMVVLVLTTLVANVFLIVKLFLF